MAKRRCATCGSRKWHKSTSSGTVTCDQGHVLQDYRTEMNERTEQVAHVMRKRTIRSTRQKKEKKSKADPILYHGERARYHYFQCLQMILRLQIQTLRELWSLPVEFEAICRDSWALHLSLLPTPPNPEPYLYAQEQGGFGPQEQAKDQNNTDERDSPDEVDTTNNEGGDGEAAEKSDSDSAASRGSEDSESKLVIRTQNLEDDSDSDQKLLDEMNERKSDDDEAEESDVAREGRAMAVDKDKLKARSRKKGKSSWRRDDTPLGTIAVLVYACWTMRVPVIYQDFIRLIKTYRLPYLDPVRLLNPSLTRHLTKHMKQALSPHFAPSTILLHRLASRLAHGAFLKYGIFTPELNAAPVLWRAVRHLGGNATLYGMTKSLARFLELPLTLNPVLAPPGSILRNITAHNRRASQSRSRSASPSKTSRSHSRTDARNTGQSSTDSGSSGQHMYDNVPPEVAFAAVCVVALKLCYGLDDGRLDFQPRGAWDPLCNMPSVEAYLSHLHDLCELQAADSDILKSRKNDAFGTSDQALPGALLEETDIDAYLEFCERALLGAHPDEEEAGNAAVEIFPLQREGMEEGRERDGEEEEAENNPVHGEGGGRSIRRELQEGRVLPAISLSVIEDGSPAASANVSRVAPGELYTVYSAHDVLGKLPDAYSLVLGRAAGWCGMNDDELGLVVERFERRLVRLYERQRRREREQQ